jgi:hypothetical protein
MKRTRCSNRWFQEAREPPRSNRRLEETRKLQQSFDLPVESRARPSNAKKVKL